MADKVLILVPVVDNLGYWVQSGQSPMWQALSLGSRVNGFRGSQGNIEAMFTPHCDNIVTLKSPQASYSLDSGTEFVHKMLLVPGDKVMVYQDPLTEKRPEGVATLVKFIGYDDAPVNYGRERIETWMVTFEGESRRVERRVLGLWTS